MCIILTMPTGTNLPSDEILNNCWERNDDGGGVMYVHNSKVIINKTIVKEEYMEILKETHAKYNGKSPIVAHFRVCTCGKADTFNCHPFEIHPGKLAYVHNGQIFKVPPDSLKSDSHLFADKLAELPKGFLKNPALLELIQVYAGSDKMVFLDNRGILTYINQDKGEVIEGVWYSNDTYKGRNWWKHSISKTYEDSLDWEDEEAMALYYRAWVGRNHRKNSNEKVHSSALIKKKDIWATEKEHKRLEEEKEGKGRKQTIESKQCTFCGTWFNKDELLDAIWDGSTKLELCLDCLEKMRSMKEENIRLSGFGKPISAMTTLELQDAFLDKDDMYDTMDFVY